MNRDTIVRVKVPMSLYESIKGKILNEDKAKKLKNLESIHENDDYSKYELLTDNLQEALYAFIDEGDYRQGDEEQLKSDIESAISRLVDQYIKRKLKPRGIEEAKESEPIEEISAQTKYNAVKKATQDAESERGKSDDLFRAKRRQQAMTAAVHINPAIESEARKIADMLTQSTGAAGFRASIDKLRDDNGSYVELEFINRGNIDDNIIFKIKKDGVKVINQDRIPKELERKLSVFVDKIRKAELDINTDDSTSSMNEAKKPSAGMSEKEKSAVAKKAKAGKDIGKKGKGFEKVASKAAKEYGSKEKGEKVAAAAMWKSQAGKKKMNEEEEMYDLYTINPNETPYWVKSNSKPLTKAEADKAEEYFMYDPHIPWPQGYWTVVKAGEYPKEPDKKPKELPKQDLKTNQSIIQRLISKITGKKMNENMNTEYGTGDSHEVVFVNQRGGSFTYFIGTREECEQYIEDNEDKLPEDVEIYRR